MQMGQFLDHDFAHSPNNQATSCCGPVSDRIAECIEIAVPPNDPFFSMPNIQEPRRSCMPMARALTSPDLECSCNIQREQVILQCTLLQDNREGGGGGKNF